MISVGGCVDTSVDVDAAGNTDGERLCLGKGQTVLMRFFLLFWSKYLDE
jgi:hypothetical protein